jgi:hypothetical protein
MNETEVALYADQLLQDEAEVERLAALLPPGGGIDEKLTGDARLAAAAKQVRTEDDYLAASAVLAHTRASIFAVRSEEARLKFERLIALSNDPVRIALIGKTPTGQEIREAAAEAERRKNRFETERAEAVKLAAFVVSRADQRERAARNRKAERAAEAQRQAAIRAETDRLRGPEHYRRSPLFNFRPGGNL